MNMLKTAAAAAIAAGTLFAAAAPAAAVEITFASFSPIGTGANIYWQNNGAANSNGTGGSFYTIASNASKVPGSALVSFSFLQPSISPFVTDVTAAFTLNAAAPSGNPATLSSPFIIQPGISGSFSFVTTSAITINTTTFAAGSNLLSATFGPASIVGQRTGSSGSFGGSTQGGTAVTYTSDFLDFSGTVDRGFQLSLTSIFSAIQAIPSTGTPTRALRTFRATSSGSFSSDPAPVVTAVPEPAVWGLMIVGFGMVGLQTRRRSRKASVAA